MGLREIVAGAILSAAAFLGGCQKPEVDFSPGFNAVEIGYTADRDARTRVMLEGYVNAGDFKVGYDGTHDLNNADPDTYFGKNVFKVGMKDVKTEGIAIVRSDGHEIVDVKGGIRNKNLIEMLGAYGRIDLVANDEAVQAEVFVGIPLHDRVSLELFQITKLPYQGKASYYTEIQPNFKLNDNFSLFARVEVGDFEFKDATYMAGVRGKF